MADSDSSTVRIDLRAVLVVLALTTVVLVIIFVQLCGSEDIDPLVEGAPPPTVDLTVEPPEPTPTEGPTPTLGPPTETPPPEPGGDERDVTREQDLGDIEAALAEYFDDNDEYPNSEGNIQSLCVFDDTDVGCELSDYLDPIPFDPLGEPASENGYWYASNGEEFVVYAQRESDAVQECDDHPDHLSQFDSLLCVRSP